MNTDVEIDPAGEVRMPCVEALLAGTLALMTGHATACCDGHRQLMAQKIAGNLRQLAEHPLLSPPFRTTLFNLQTLWQLRLESRGVQVPAQTDERLWHVTPPSVQ